MVAPRPLDGDVEALACGAPLGMLLLGCLQPLGGALQVQFKLQVGEQGKYVVLPATTFVTEL